VAFCADTPAAGTRRIRIIKRRAVAASEESCMGLLMDARDFILDGKRKRTPPKARSTAKVQLLCDYIDYAQTKEGAKFSYLDHQVIVTDCRPPFFNLIHVIGARDLVSALARGRYWSCVSRFLGSSCGRGARKLWTSRLSARGKSMGRHDAAPDPATSASATEEQPMKPSRKALDAPTVKTFVGTNNLPPRTYLAAERPHLRRGLKKPPR
jgi:hypothetical protein